MAFFAFPWEFFLVLSPLQDKKNPHGWNMSQVTLGAGAAKRSARSWPMDAIGTGDAKGRVAESPWSPCYPMSRLSNCQVAKSVSSFNKPLQSWTAAHSWPNLMAWLGKLTRVVTVVSLQRCSPYSSSPRLNATAANLGSQSILLVDARHINTGQKL